MNQKPTPTCRRLLALAAAIILAGLYILTLLFAVTGNENTMGMLMASLFASIAIPIFIYVFQLASKVFRKGNSHKNHHKDQS